MTRGIAARAADPPASPDNFAGLAGRWRTGASLGLAAALGRGSCSTVDLGALATPRNFISRGRVSAV
jgi:hypothetical protein